MYRKLLVTAASTLVLLITLATPTYAQSTDNIVDEIVSEGHYSDFRVDSSLKKEIEQANDSDIGFVWLDQSGAGTVASEKSFQIAEELQNRNSKYNTVVVLLLDGVGADSTSISAASVDTALDASTNEFGDNQVAAGLDDFTNSAKNGTPISNSNSDTRSENAASTGSNNTSNEDSGGGIGRFLFIILLFGLPVLAFFAFRSWRKKSKAKEQAAVDLEEDRAEIKKQLADNADLVIELGDKVIASGDPELVKTYEEASMAYQQVSREIDQAATAEAVDMLDDKIDHAEWQFTSIQAKLDGKTPPPSPTEVEEEQKRQEQTDRDKPALDKDESVFGYPRSRTRVPRTQQRQSKSGGGLGGLLGGLLGGGLGSLGGYSSRRTQDRRSTGGSFGGGVFGGGGNRSTGGSSRRRGSGRSFGSSRRRGSGRSF